MANPLLGSTSTHMSALFVLLGDEKTKNLLLQFKDNNIQILESNSMVRDEVVIGNCWVGLTDTDDAYDAIKDGKAVKMIFPDQFNGGIGDLIIPNAIMMIKGAKHPEDAKKFIDFILSSKVEEELAKSALQMPLKRSSTIPENFVDVKALKSFNVSYDNVTEKLSFSNNFLQNVFIR
jgi:iron(III) transport system substrate-binding protein